MYSIFRAITWIVFVGACILVYTNPEVFGIYPVYIKVLALLLIFLPLIVTKSIMHSSSKTSKEPVSSAKHETKYLSISEDEIKYETPKFSLRNEPDGVRKLYVTGNGYGGWYHFFSVESRNNPDKTPEWDFPRAFNENNADKMRHFASCYLWGVYGCKSEERAFDLYGEAAQLGDTSAMLDLSICYRKGIGCEINQSEAEFWEYKSAMLGHPRAQYSIGKHRQNGNKADLVEAYAFMYLASVSERDAEHERYRLELKLTSQQIQQGLQRSRELQAQILANKK
jgi:TPR repeat protein